MWNKPPDEWDQFLKNSQPGFAKDTRAFLTGETNNIPELARIQVADSYAQPWVVQLAPVGRGARAGVDGQGDDGSFFDPQFIKESFATIRFGRGGIISEVVVDWPSGGQHIQVYGSYIQVRGGVVDLAEDFAPQPIDLTQFLRANITPGNRFGSFANPARRTVQYGTLSPGDPEPPQVNSRIRAVPRFSKAVSFSFFDATDGFNFSDFFVIGFANIGGVPIWSAEPPFIAGPNILFASFSLPNGTNYIRIQNLDNMRTMEEVRAIYELDM